jgi:hypothetical protein
MIAAISPVKLIIGSRCYFVFSEVTEEVVSLLEVGYAAAAPPQPVLYRSSGSLNSLLAVRPHGCRGSFYFPSCAEPKFYLLRITSLGSLKHYGAAND